MARRVAFYRRGFLNHPRHQSIALFLAQAETTRGVRKAWTNKVTGVTTPEVAWADLEASLTLGDCNRQITLEFSTGSDSSGADIGNVQHKIDLLRKLVNDFADAVDEGLNQVRDQKFKEG